MIKGSGRGAQRPRFLHGSTVVEAYDLCPKHAIHHNKLLLGESSIYFMPPRTTAAPQASTNTDNIVNNSWDGGPLTKKYWRDTQEEQLTLLPTPLDSSFQTLWERGYFFDRTNTITVSTEHSYQLGIDNVQPGTFHEPCDPFNLKLKNPTLTYAAAFSLAQMNDALIDAAVFKAKLESQQPHNKNLAKNRRSHRVPACPSRAPAPRTSTRSRPR